MERMAERRAAEDMREAEGLNRRQDEVERRLRRLGVFVDVRDRPDERPEAPARG